MLKWVVGFACLFGFCKVVEGTRRRIPVKYIPDFKCFLCQSHSDGPKQAGLWIMKCHRCGMENNVRLAEGQTNLIQGEIPYIEVPRDCGPPDILERVKRPTFTETQQSQNSDANQ